MIPKGMLEEAVDYSLTMTFAANPKSRNIAEWVKFMGKPPMSLINPFPRFQVGSVIPFVMEHSPLGYGHMMSPKVLKQLASGNPDEFAKAASRATIGVVMMDMAFRFRGDSDLAGQRWFEIKSGTNEDGTDNFVDARPFAPFSLYLLFAEMFAHPERIRNADYAEAIIGINRVTGTGLMLTDFIRDEKNTQEALSKFGAQYAASFATPIRTLKDFSSAATPEEDIRRDLRQEPIIGPFINNLPFISDLLPEFKSPFDTDPQRTQPLFGLPGPLARQFTGLSNKRKSPLLKELESIDYDIRKTFTRTGIEEADNAIQGETAIIAERTLRELKDKSQYQELTKLGKRVVWEVMMSLAKKEARRVVGLKDPSLGIRAALQSQVPKTMQEFIKEQTGIDIKTVIEGDLPISSLNRPSAR